MKQTKCIARPCDQRIAVSPGAEPAAGCFCDLISAFALPFTGHRSEIGMLLKRLFLLVLLGCGVLVGHPAIAADWIGKKIMPKSDTVALRVDGRVSGNVYNIQWPAVVKTVDGNWLWIEDDGGTSPAGGWIRSDDAVLFNGALNQINSRLVTGSQAGGQYWLRGICWENAQEFDLAAKDYAAAVQLQPMNPDARLGLARVTAKTKYDDQKFVQAWQLNRSLPRFFVDWGQALESAGQHDRARAMYQQAMRLNPNWRMPHYSLGKLAAAQGQHEDALVNYDEAIRRDATFYLAYRERATSCLACTKKKDAATAALSSARKACELCYFRNADSLAVLAQSLAALKQWPDASRYQQMAYEYASLTAKPVHKQRWREYYAQATRKEAVASNDARPTIPVETSKGFDPEDTADPDSTPSKPIRLPFSIDRSSSSFE
jgi:tetratricopeptide (TPR) repeat protein